MDGCKRWNVVRISQVMGFWCATLIALCGASAQQNASETEIPDAASCPRCSVSVRTLVSLGSKEGAGALTGSPAHVRQDRLGRYWVSPREGSALLFDSTGKFISAVGRVGRGPGEYIGYVTPHFLGVDSILLVDEGARRATMVTNDLKIVRTIDLSTTFALSELVGRRLVGSGAIGTPSAAGFPLHIMPIDGPRAEIAKSFGPVHRSGPKPADETLGWRIAVGSSGAFWTLDVDEYRIRSWTADGQMQKEFIRRPEWFAQKSIFARRSFSEPPEPVMWSLVEDTDRILWVHGRSASALWAARSGRRTGTGASSSTVPGEIASSSRNSLQLYQINIELIDPAMARVVTRLTLQNEMLISWLPSRRAAFYSEDASGYPLLRIVQLTLNR